MSQEWVLFSSPGSSGTDKGEEAGIFGRKVTNRRWHLRLLQVFAEQPKLLPVASCSRWCM